MTRPEPYAQGRVPPDRSKLHRPPDHFLLSSPFFFFPRNDSRILRGTKVIARPSLNETEFVSSLYLSVILRLNFVIFLTLFLSNQNNYYLRSIHKTYLCLDFSASYDFPGKRRRYIFLFPTKAPPPSNRYRFLKYCG